MATEHDHGPVPLRKIHIDIDLASRAVTFGFAAEGLPVTRLTLSPAGILYQLIGLSARSDQPGDEPIAPPEAAVALAGEGLASDEAKGAAKPKDLTVALTGRLKSQPKEGRPDNQGHPTAYARFAAHEEGAESGHLYLATFHRASRRIALGLAADDQITVEGYPHPSDDPSGKRLDTLSVFRFLNYPGKPEKPG
jgi:hypothetical protein